MSVKSKPRAPLAFTAHREPITGEVAFNFIPALLNSSHGIPISYLFEYRPVSETHWKYLTETDSTNYKLTNKDLKPDVNYEFRISSQNLYGKSSPVETVLPAIYNSSKNKKFLLCF